MNKSLINKTKRLIISQQLCIVNYFGIHLNLWRKEHINKPLLCSRFSQKAILLHLSLAKALQRLFVSVNYSFIILCISYIIKLLNLNIAAG